MLASRTMLSYSDYETFYSFPYPNDGSYCEIPDYHTRPIRLAAIKNHKRIYEVIPHTATRAEPALKQSLYEKYPCKSHP
jgi:hydroxymethylglutaryl-CoA synthase